MALHGPRPSLTVILTFADKLDQLRSTLTEPEQRLLDGVVLAACGEHPAPGALGMSCTVIKRAAILAAAALGLASGHLGGLRARTAHVASGGSSSSGQQCAPLL
jgi:hypothetical protein